MIENKIGFLLPLSGQYTGYGEKVKKGVEMALQDYNEKLPARNQVLLVSRDSQEDPQEAPKQALDLIQQEKVVALIGPLLSNTLQAESSVANDNKVPFITPSAAQEGLTATGPYIFRNALIPERQARATAEFAVNEKKLKRFAYLYPNSPYGSTSSRLFPAGCKSWEGNGGQPILRAQPDRFQNTAPSP